MRTTSGRAERASGDRLSPVTGLADNLDVTLAFEDHLEAGPDQRLVIDQHDPDAHAASRGQWEDRVDRESTSWTGVGTQVTAVKSRTLAHTDQPMPGRASDPISLRSWSVIENLDLKLGGSGRWSPTCAVEAWECLRTLVSASWMIR